MLQLISQYPVCYYINIFYSIVSTKFPYLISKGFCAESPGKCSPLQTFLPVSVMHRAPMARVFSPELCSQAITVHACPQTPTRLKRKQRLINHLVCGWDSLARKLKNKQIWVTGKQSCYTLYYIVVMFIELPFPDTDTVSSPSPCGNIS